MIQIFGTPTNPWTMPHTYGDEQPHVDAFDVDGAWLLVKPVHTTNLVTVTFAKPTAGRLVLTDTGGAGGGTTIPVTKPSIGRPVSGRMR